VANITNFLNFTTSTNPTTADYIVGFVNDPGVRGQYEYKTSVYQLFTAFNTYNATLTATGITPDRLSTGHPSWDTSGNFSVPGALTVTGTIASNTNIGTSNGILYAQGSTNSVKLYDRNGNSSNFTSIYKAGGTTYFDDSLKGGTVFRFTSAGNVYGNISANLSSAGGISLSTTNNITTVNGTTLLNLIYTLSSQMMKIGNYPYLEYAWVGAPSAAGQTITANTVTTCIINTEIADSGNYGSISSNQVTLSAGTYTYEVHIAPTQDLAGGAGIIYSLYNVDTAAYISRTSAHGGPSGPLVGQFTIGSTTRFEIRVVTADNCVLTSNGDTYNFSNTLASGVDQRTTIKLWKVG
jgi:hypothetical protein